MARPASRSASFTIALLGLFFLLGLTTATCYFPNGDTESDHFSCDPNSTGAVTCCTEGFQCLSNGLCADPRYKDWQRVLRGACTDKAWGEGCMGVCKDDWPQGDEAVNYCGNGKYCCGRSNECCNDSTMEKLNLGEPQVVAIAGGTGAQVSSTPSSQQASASTAAFLSNRPSDPSATITLSPASEISTRASPVTVTVISGRTFTVAPSAPDPAPTSTPSDFASGIYRGANKTIAIGVGVGVSVGIMLFVSVFGGFLYLQRKKKRKKENGIMERNIGSGIVNTFERDESEYSTGNRLRGSRNGQVHEMSAEKMHEMPGQGDPKELDGKEGERIVQTSPY